MFGDFFANFKINFPFLGADNAGGIWGKDPEKEMQKVLAAGGPGGGVPAVPNAPGGPQLPAGAPGQGQAPGAATVAQPPPTGSGVTHAPMTVAGSALQPGGNSPLGPLGPGQQLQQGGDRLAPGGELAELLRKFDPGGSRAS